MDRKALVGLLSGVSLVIATLIGVALVNTREAEGASSVAQRNVPRDCAVDAAPVETGYAAVPPNAVCARAY